MVTKQNKGLIKVVVILAVFLVIISYSGNKDKKSGFGCSHRAVFGGSDMRGTTYSTYEQCTQFVELWNSNGYTCSPECVHIANGYTGEVTCRN